MTGRISRCFQSRTGNMRDRTCSFRPAEAKEIPGRTLSAKRRSWKGCLSKRPPLVDVPVNPRPIGCHQPSSRGNLCRIFIYIPGVFAKGRIAEHAYDPETLPDPRTKPPHGLAKYAFASGTDRRGPLLFPYGHCETALAVWSLRKQQPHQRATFPAAGAENEIKLPALAKSVLTRVTERHQKLYRQLLSALVSPVLENTPAARRTGTLEKSKPSLPSSIVWLEGLFQFRHLLLQFSDTGTPEKTGLDTISHRSRKRKQRRPQIVSCK